MYITDPITVSLLTEWYYTNIKAYENGTTESMQMVALINLWPNNLRLEVRNKLEAMKCPGMIILRNLEYNYETQEWI